MSARAFDELLKNFMDSLGIPEKTVITEWERLAGKEMAAHVRVTDLSGGILRLEADHPGWSQIVNLQKKELLERINREFPDEKTVKIMVALGKQRQCDS